MGHRSRALRLLAGAALASCIALGLPPAAPAAGGGSATAAETAEVVDVPVRFTVQNLNRSRVPCPTDGGSYEIAGHLVAPAAALSGGVEGVALHLHGLGFGEFYWHFKDVPGYDYATEQALAGHASVVIDRLGYDASGHPVGRDVCVGAHADVASQIVAALREGSYTADGATAPAFERVALVGHSLGSQIAQVAAYSFGGVDAIVTTAYASEGATPAAADTSLRSGLVCAGGGESAEGSQPGGYAYFGQTADDFHRVMFHDVDPAVAQAATAMRNRDPCGDHASVLPAMVSNRAWLRGVSVPVLIVCGDRDALFDGGRCAEQEAAYESSDDVSTVVLTGTAHAIALERTRAQFRAAMSDWLRAHGF